MNNYVVYRHLKTNNEVFYIGMGKPYRPYYKHNRSSFWNNIVKKHGLKIEILAENLDLESAKDLEIFLIELYGRKDLGLGPLCNLTDGGEKRTYTQEQRLQMSISNKGKKHIFTNEESLKNVQLNQFKKGHSIHNKKVINIKTGQIWESAKICHLKENLKITVGHFRDMMSGLKNNKTNYQYLKNYEQ